jgi:tetratricopeptide (TPR) repeat protein
LHDALKLYVDNFALFEQLESDALKGKFHHEFAIILRDLGGTEQRQDYTDRALIEFSAASVYFEQAKLARHQACVENNLGMLYGTIGKFADAHEHLDRAQALFTRLNDKVHNAQVDESRARVMIAEGEFVKAEKLVSRVGQQIRELRRTSKALQSALAVFERNGCEPKIDEAVSVVGRRETAVETAKANHASQRRGRGSHLHHDAGAV